MSRAESGSKFFWASAAGSVLTAIRVATGFVRSKYIAVVLGPTGVGLLSQAGQLQLVGITFVSLAVGAGITNRLASSTARGDEVTARKLLATSLAIQLAMSLVIILAALVGSGAITRFAFPGDHAGGSWWAFAVLMSAPLYAVSSTFIYNVLLGLNRYDLYIRASIWGTLLSFAAAMPLLVFGGLNGGMWAYCASGVTTFIPAVYILSKARRLRDVFILGFDRDEFKWLARFCATVLIVTAAEYLSSFLIRRQVIATLGAAANGVLQVPLALTSYYTPLVTGGLWGYFFPTVARLGHGQGAEQELSSILKYMGVLCAGFVVLLLAGQELLIYLAYSRAFLEAAHLMPIQFVADFAYFIAFTFSIYFLGTSKLRFYLAGWLGYHSLQITLVVVLLPRLGLWACPVAYLSASSTMAIVSLIWYCRAVDSDAKLRTVASVALCVLVVVAQAVLAARTTSLVLRAILPLVFGGVLAFRNRDRLRALVESRLARLAAHWRS